MDFAATLTDMFPQVRGDIIQIFIDQIGNSTEAEFALISDMVLTYIEENIDIPVLANSKNVSADIWRENIAEHVSITNLRNESVIGSRPIAMKRRVSNSTNVTPAHTTVTPAHTTVTPAHTSVIPAQTTVRPAHSTGAIPKRPLRVRSTHSSIHTNIINNNGIGAKEHHYSKMTLVRNAVPKILDDNDNIECIDLTINEDQDKIFKHFLNMLPQADPTYLRQKAEFFHLNPAESAEEFILERIENEDFPTINEYLGKLDELNAKKAFTTNFNLQAFLIQFPNAPEHFAAIDNPYSADDDIMNQEKSYVLHLLLNKYRRMRMNDIEKIYKRNKYNIIKTCDLLDRSKEQLFEDRPLLAEEKIEECTNIGLLQMLAYIKHRNKIDAQVFAETERLEFARAEAIASNSFLTCACCYRDDLLPEDCVTCVEGCLFCRECVKTGAEHCLAEAKTQYSCLSDCESTFTDGTLQSVLSTITYQRLTQRRQMEEVAEAKIPGLETCPFCDYATIPAEEDKIFQCENIDCKKVSCRKCRHESHLPLRCNEIEYDEDVRLRTEIENKMSEAMLRFKCAGCQKAIIKIDGCNKITCPCGKISCYVCKQAIKNYGHFGGRCQLWENAEVTREDILRQANRAKEALGLTADPDKLKFDPTRNF